MQISNQQDFSSGTARPKLSELLRRDIDEFVNDIRRNNGLLEQARRGGLSPETVGRYLRSIHYLLRHTPIHLSLAEERARHLGHTDLAAYYALKKVAEEGHDCWAEADMDGFATRFRVPVPDEPSITMKVLVDANAEAIKQDPFYYLAYILFAEYFVVVVGPEWLRALAENCGVPELLMTAVANHVVLDRDHTEEGCAEIDALVRPEHAAGLRRALAGMMRRLSDFSDELCGAQRS